ncbi:MAG: hypothetical protein C5B51_21440 [Terriglobia bacterium]|nr:MAG: hypothetical protein C5B51_21440 [Terriglobia bacterium]
MRKLRRSQRVCVNAGRWFWPSIAIVVAAAGILEVSSALEETQTWDEGIHISAGYAYWALGDYRWNPEHPPLAKLLAALPLTRLPLRLPVASESWRKRDETGVGIDFLYRNGVPADTILLTARSMTILLSLLFLTAVAWWTRRRFGASAALLAVALCAFDPNLIAHARYVTTDFPVTVFFFLAGALWLDYLLGGRFRDLLAAGLAFALAMATKFSAILLIPALALLYAIRWWQTPKEFPLRRTAVAAAVLAGSTAALVSVLYWPETWRCLTTEVPRLAGVVKPEGPIGMVLYRVGRWFHLPAHAFLTGLNDVAGHNRAGHSSYLMGLRSDQGWWYYFPVVFAVKSTIAALAATALLPLAGIKLLRRTEETGFLWLGLLVPPVLYFLFSMTSAINIGMRHILPVYPFLYIAAAGLLDRAFPRRMARIAMFALGTLQIAECASIAPDYLAFFNALAGGPGKGPQYLVDSNIDWGQDIKKLARWLRAHGTNTATIMYFGNAQMAYYGINSLNFPAPMDRKSWDALDGFAVASVTPLEGVYVPLDALARLRLGEPIAKVGWSLYVYDFRKRAGPTSHDGQVR